MNKKIDTNLVIRVKMDELNEKLRDDLELEKIELEVQKNNEINIIYDDLSHIYDEIIGRYQNGEFAIYNPHIFRKLTKKFFINWVITNNADLEKEIEQYAGL